MINEWRSPAFLLGGILTLLGILSGLLISVGGSKTGRGLASDDAGWSRFDIPAAVEAEKNGFGPIELAQKLLDSGAFGRDESGNPFRLVALDSQNGTGRSGADKTEVIPPFPTVIAAAIVDASPTIYLQLGDGQVLAVHEGETLDSGWSVTSITLNRVQAKYGTDDPVSYPVFQHQQPELKKKAQSR